MTKTKIKTKTKTKNKIFGVFFNPHKVGVADILKQFESWATKKHVDLCVFREWPASIPRLDAAIAVGGDGTILRLGRYLASSGIPILGVNVGRLGFLAETSKAEVWDMMDEIYAVKHPVQKRVLLDIKVKRNGAIFRKYLAVNDIVLRSGEKSRIVDVNTWVDEEFVARYTGDGVIVSTPTGSTAYSLAAGGPIVYPTLPVVVITAICPHTMTLRPLLVGVDKVISIKDIQKKQDMVLSIDGQITQKIFEGDEIIISKSKKTIELITTDKRSYFEVLREKLNWGNR